MTDETNSASCGGNWPPPTTAHSRHDGRSKETSTRYVTQGRLLSFNRLIVPFPLVLCFPDSCISYSEHPLLSVEQRLNPRNRDTRCVCVNRTSGSKPARIGMISSNTYSTARQKHARARQRHGNSKDKMSSSCSMAPWLHSSSQVKPAKKHRTTKK